MPKGSRKQPEDSLEGSAIQQIRQCITNGHLNLVDGTSLPVVIGACNKHRDVPIQHNMPVSEGFNGEKKVKFSGTQDAAVQL